MSKNSSEERNDPLMFSDSNKTEDFDSDLQSQLYARIYYESNLEDESDIRDVPKMMQFNDITGDSSLVTEKQHRSENEQSAESEVITDRSVVASKAMAQDDALVEAVKSTQSYKDKICDEETNPVSHETDNVNKTRNSVIKKKSTSSSSKKSKSSKHTRNVYRDDRQENNAISTSNTEIYSKCNVLPKHAKQEMLIKKFNQNKRVSDDSSDSEQSIFEVPVPPKPKPLVINLQDSEEEDNTNSQMDEPNTLLRSWDDKDASKYVQNLSVISNISKSNIARSSDNRECTSSKNKSSGQSSFRKNTPTDLECRLQTSTHVQESGQDIILNCTVVQKGARSMNDIRQLSTNTKSYKIPNALTVEVNQNSRKIFQSRPKNAPQNMSRTNDPNNANLQDGIFRKPLRISPRMKMAQGSRININYDANIVQHLDEDEDLCDRTISSADQFSYDNVIARKRQLDNMNESNSATTKRQCIIVRSNQDVTPQCSSNEGRRDDQSSGSRNESSGQFFNSMTQRLRNCFYSGRGQENFSVTEVQRGMSRDPRLWTILDEDMIPLSGRQRDRFWNVKCTNCHHDGHQRYDCPMPRKPLCCHMCGRQGHIESRCPKKICLTCGKQQSTFRKTCEYCRVLYCTMCNSIGHKVQQCPDLWRRYHQTTSMDNVPPQDPGNVMKSSNMLHCCNCTKRGHEFSACHEYRWSQHFTTPAAVSDYNSPPVYMVSATTPVETNFQTHISTPKICDEMSSQRPHNATSQFRSDTRQAMEERAGSSAEISLSSANATSSPQEDIVCIEETRKHSYSPVVFDGSSMFKQKKNKNIKITKVDFTDVVYNCGIFKHEKRTNAMIISQELSTLKRPEHSFTIHRSKKIIDNLAARKIAPVFFEKLREKVEFQVTIGFAGQHKTMMIQVIAEDGCVMHLFDLLLHWIYIPDDEKDYGVDATLPINPAKMYNLLNTRKRQLEKMSFTSYNDCMKQNENDPRYLYRTIKEDKDSLQHHKGTSEYYRLRTKLWRLQVKLLIMTNTVPNINNYVPVFWKEMNLLSQKLNKEKIKVGKYLKLTLLYNRLFVPHTSPYLNNMLNCINRHQEKLKKEECPSQTQRRVETTTSCKREDFALYTNKNALLSPATSCTVQNIDFTEDPSLIPQQDADNSTFIEKNDAKNVLPGTSDVTNDKCNKMFIIDTVGTQHSQTTMPLTTEPKPESVQKSECTGNDEDQSLKSDMDYKDDILTAGDNEDKQNVINQMQRQRSINSKRKTQHRKRKLEEINNSEQARQTALQCISEARAFKVPHMMNAAAELQRKVNSNMVKYGHIDALRKFIKLERKYQRNIKNYPHYFQK